MWRRKNCPGPIGLPDPVYWVFGRKPQPMGPILGTQRLGLCRPWSELAIYSDTLCPMISQLFFPSRMLGRVMNLSKKTVLRFKTRHGALPLPHTYSGVSIDPPQVQTKRSINKYTSKSIKRTTVCTTPKKWILLSLVFIFGRTWKTTQHLHLENRLKKKPMAFV